MMISVKNVSCLVLGELLLPRPLQMWDYLTTAEHHLRMLQQVAPPLGVPLQCYFGRDRREIGLKLKFRIAHSEHNVYPIATVEGVANEFDAIFEYLGGICN